MSSQLSDKIRKFEEMQEKETFSNFASDDHSNLLQGISYVDLDKEIPQDALCENSIKNGKNDLGKYIGFSR